VSATGRAAVRAAAGRRVAPRSPTAVLVLCAASLVPLASRLAPCAATLPLWASALAPQSWDAAWAAGEREDAVALMEEALADDPDDETLRRSLAERQMAIHRYEAALATAGDDTGRSSVRGRALYLLGRYEEALEHLDPDDPLEAVMRVDAHEVLGHEEETWAALRSAESVLGRDTAALLSLRGRLLARAGRHEEAVDAFERALAVDAFDRAALHGLGRSRLGRREEATAVLDRHRALVPLLDQLDFARRAVDLGPLHAANHALVGDAERALGRRDEALAAYVRAGELATPGELGPVLLRHARLLDEDLGRRDEAVAVLDAGWERARDPRLPVRAGDLLADAGRWDEALARYDAALAVRPGDPQIEARRRAVLARSSGEDDR